jgi:hypothetical protein
LAASNIAFEALPLIRRYSAAHDSDLGAVAGRHIVDVVRQIERSGTGLVRRDHVRPAREMVSQMPRKQPPIGVVAESGRREADEQPDLLAGERDRRPVARRLRRRAPLRQEQRRHDRGDQEQ